MNPMGLVHHKNVVVAVQRSQWLAHCPTLFRDREITQGK